MSNNFLNRLPIIGGLTDTSGDDGIAQLAKNAGLYENLQVPTETWQNYDPSAFSSQSADATTVKEDPSLINNQMDVLNKLSGLSQNGLSDVDQAAYEKARTDAGQIARQQTDAALNNAEARGLSGSGMEFAMREAAGQNAANSAQSADLQQAADAARMRAMYTQAYGQQAGQVRGQNYQTGANNANILNNFNMANTQQRNATSQANTQQSNQAQLINQQGRTGIQQQNYQNQLAKINGQAGANAQVAQGDFAQNAANTSSQNALLTAGVNAYTGGAFGAAKKAGGGNGYGDNGSIASGGIGNSSDWATAMGAPGYAHGGVVPGIANVPGDSPVNDTFNLNASPGEGIIPREHMQSPRLAKAFVDHMFGKK